MKNIEVLRTLLNQPVEQLAELLAAERYDNDPTARSYGLGDMFYNNTPEAEYCLEHHSNDEKDEDDDEICDEELCPYLDDYYDYECPDLYGACRLAPGEKCPYAVDRRQIFKDYLIDWFSKDAFRVGQD
jgi:hypothetical protein